MEITELLQQIFNVCIVPLLGVLTAYAVKFINIKAKELEASADDKLTAKYIEMLDKTICECVIATNQTYVNSLKDKDAFDKQAQAQAFNKTFEAVKAVLTDEARVYLAQIYSDIDSYIATKIEAEVNINR